MYKTFQANRHIYAIDNETLEMFSLKPKEKHDEKLKKTQGRVGCRRYVFVISQLKDVLKFTQKIPTWVCQNLILGKFHSMTTSNRQDLASLELCTTNKTIPEILVWDYHLILNKKPEIVFGQVALEMTSQKRTVTIIATEHYQLGFLTKEVYNDCIKEANERTIENNINFILSNKIFKVLNKQIFEKKNVFNFFMNSMKISQMTSFI